MSHGFFREKDRVPTEMDVGAVLGKGKECWDGLVMYLLDERKLKAGYKFYGKNYGWALGFTRRGRSVVSLYPDEDDFCMQIILNEEQEERALRSIDDGGLRKVIHDTARIHEGKWIFMKASQFKDAGEMKRLVAIRCGDGNPTNSRWCRLSLHLIYEPAPGGNSN